MPPLSQEDAKDLIARRHPEWAEHQENWRWLLDSLEGGNRYKHADYYRGPFDPIALAWYAYGFDETNGEGYTLAYGTIAKRNLMPHRSEMDVQNRDQYTLRLGRTPVPRVVARVVRRYLSRIYAKQVTRQGPKLLESWQANTDGRGTSIKKWMRKKIGPLLLVLGQLDIVVGHPETPADVEIRTLADRRRLKLDQAIASYILPENMVWWKTDCTGAYIDCLVFERTESGAASWRHWTAEGSYVYSAEGEYQAEGSFEHPFGRVPIVRVFDDVNLRCRNVGQSRMEPVAELQKSIYNRKSELVLNDVQNCHALLQGPEEYCTGDTKVPIGPGGLLPKKKSSDGTYEGFDFLDPPQSGAEECRQHVLDDQDEVMLEAALLKPAGMTSGSTVAQSGISKIADQSECNDVLAEVAETLADAEEAIASLVMLVQADGKPDPKELDKVEVEYPKEYDLFTAADLAAALADIQAIVDAAGGLPATEAEVLKRLITVLLPGLDEERLGELHAEIVAKVDMAASRRDAAAEAGNLDSASASAASGAYSTEDPAFVLPPGAAQAVEVANTLSSPDFS